MYCFSTEAKAKMRSRNIDKPEHFSSFGFTCFLPILDLQAI